MKKFKLFSISLFFALSANISTAYAGGDETNSDGKPNLTKCEYLESIGISNGKLWEAFGCHILPTPGADTFCIEKPQLCPKEDDEGQDSIGGK